MIKQELQIDLVADYEIEELREQISKEMPLIMVKVLLSKGLINQNTYDNIMKNARRGM